MRTIHKFQVSLGETTVPMPEGARILPTQRLGNAHILLWAVIPDTTAPKVDCRFVVVGTGEPLPPGGFDHIGTVFQGPLVWHLLELTDVPVPVETRDHRVKVNIDFDESGDPRSWDVAVCGCATPWVHRYPADD